MICLDFDGVLFDTAKEAFVVGYKTFFDVDSNHETLGTNYKRFLLLRPFVDSAWQYLTVFNLLSDNLNDELMLIEGRQRLKIQPQKKDREFESKFHFIRTELMKNNRSKWIKLHEPYEFFKLIKPLMIRYPKQFQISSTKSVEFILELLSLHGVSLDKRQVWGRDMFEINSHSKAKIIRQNVDNNEAILFVDDSYRHINEVQCLENVEAILASWGYVESGKIENNCFSAIEKIKYYLDNNVTINRRSVKRSVKKT